VDRGLSIEKQGRKIIASVLVEQVFTRFGVPLSILSDEGKEVDGIVMQEVSDYLVLRS